MRQAIARKFKLATLLQQLEYIILNIVRNTTGAACSAQNSTRKQITNKDEQEGYKQKFSGTEGFECCYSFEEVLTEDEGTFFNTHNYYCALQGSNRPKTLLRRMIKRMFGVKQARCSPSCCFVWQLSGFSSLYSFA